MFYIESKKIFKEDSVELFRKLGLFSNVEAFSALVQNNVGDDHFKIWDAIGRDRVGKFLELLPIIANSVGILGDKVDWSFDFVDKFGDKEPCFVFHYPEITVTMINDPDVSHTCKDLFVIVPIVCRNEKWNFNSSLYVFRSHFTNEEAQSGWVHSHTLEYNKNSKVTKFCIGSSDLADIVYKMVSSDTYDKCDYEAFFLLLDAMLSSESTVGVPYPGQQIRKIGNREGTSSTPYFPTTEELIEKFCLTKDNFRLFKDGIIDNIVIRNSLLSFKDENKYRDCLLNLFKEYFQECLCCVNPSGFIVYYGLDSDDSDIQITEDIFTYKGKEYKVIVEQKNREEVDTDLNGYFLQGSYICRVTKDLNKIFVV